MNKSYEMVNTVDLPKNVTYCGRCIYTSNQLYLEFYNYDKRMNYYIKEKIPVLNNQIPPISPFHDDSVDDDPFDDERFDDLTMEKLLIKKKEKLLGFYKKSNGISTKLFSTDTKKTVFYYDNQKKIMYCKKSDQEITYLNIGHLLRCRCDDWVKIN